MNNYVQIIGRLTKDTELRVSESGNKIVRGSLAVQRQYKNPNGEYDTDFIKFVAYNQIGERISEYCHKGDLLAISGMLKTGSYEDSDGKKRYTMEVAANRVTFLSSKPKDINTEVKNESISSTKTEDIREEDPFKEFGNEVVIDDSMLPF